MIFNWLRGRELEAENHRLNIELAVARAMHDTIKQAYYMMDEKEGKRWLAANTPEDVLARIKQYVAAV